MTYGPIDFLALEFKGNKFQWRDPSSSARAGGKQDRAGDRSGHRHGPGW